MGGFQKLHIFKLRSHLRVLKRLTKLGDDPNLYVSTFFQTPRESTHKNYVALTCSRPRIKVKGKHTKRLTPCIRDPRSRRVIKEIFICN